MKSYKSLPIWENLKRQKELNDYKESIDKYFNLVEFDQYSRSLIDSEESKKIRTLINKHDGFIQTYLISAGMSPNVTHTPPPAIGGYIQNINMVENLFNLFNFDIEPQILVDTIDKAIGIYERDFIPSVIRTVNPLFWLGIILESIASIPFYLLGSVGFNRNKIEGSIFGKITKWLIKIVTLIFGLLEGMARLKLWPESIDITKLFHNYLRLR